MKDKLYQLAPNFIQNLLVTLFNVLAYRDRYGSAYKKYRAEFKKNQSLSRDELEQLQAAKFLEFMQFVKANSRFYSNKRLPLKIGDLQETPILKKEELRSHIDAVYTIAKSQGVVSKTGGTTGKSLEVLFTKDDMQQRFAMLDDFRSRYGYALGKKTAWFSGKNLLTASDLSKSRFWKTDKFYNVRYYSTFHIKSDYLKFYVEDLIKYQPEYLVGFPSTILEIAKYGRDHGYDFPANVVKAIFPTAETITQEMKVIETFFKSKMYNQYASSEGAPFIMECQNGKLHLELQSGIFEVLDDNDLPTASGRLVVTSFTTKGTPLVRYDIGDSIVLEAADATCDCGNNNPLVKEILGRIDDYVYSPQNGKINLGNVSNTLKDTAGIVKFQVVQEELDAICIYVMTDPKIYNERIEATFLKNWRDRVGSEMKIEIKPVQDIPNEKSGKYRMVKNNIKHLI